MISALEPELLARLTAAHATDDQAAVEELDEHLAAAMRHSALMRRGFYAAVLVVSLYGTATGAVTAFDLPWFVAVGGILALELGGVVFLSNADVRRRLGEQAILSRLIGGAVAGAAATFNVVTHDSVLLGGFFALMSVLGFVTWWLDTENKRRDRLRARGHLSTPTPVYALWGHWLRHPFVTARARNLAKAHPSLGLYGSLEASLIVMRRERRNEALARALRSRIRRAVGKDMARIAALTFDMDEVADRLRGGADYDGLTALLGSELTAERVLHGRNDHAAEAARVWLSAHATAAATVDPTLRSQDRTEGKWAGEGPVDIRRVPDVGSRGLVEVGGSTWDPVSRPTTEGSSLLEALNGRPYPLPALATDDAANAPGRRHPTARPLVRVRVVGSPALLDADGGAVKGLRAKSVELLVYLAVHRHGAALNRITDAVWPDVTGDRAAQRLSTCLANLRAAMRSTVTADADAVESGTRVEPIVNTGGHYHLAPSIVHVDWWQLLDEHEQTDPLSAAVAEGLALLAEGCDYPWLDDDPLTLIRSGQARSTSQSALATTPIAAGHGREEVTVPEGEQQVER